LFKKFRKLRLEIGLIAVVVVVVTIAQPEGIEHSGRPVRNLILIVRAALRPTPVRSKHMSCSRRS
jgi:hypothetical protein